MDSTTDRYGQAIKQLIAGDTESALRLSGEYLAEADAALHTAGTNVSDRRLDEFLHLATLHSALLILTGQPCDGLSCALMSCVNASITGIGTRHDCHAAFVGLLTKVVEGSCACIDGSPVSGDTIELGMRLTTLGAVLLNHFISGLSQSQRHQQAIKASASILDNMRGTVDFEHPAVIDGVETPPDNLKPYLAEMLGIASQLGFLRID